jgi:hypothetical protein
MKDVLKPAEEAGEAPGKSPVVTIGPRDQDEPDTSDWLTITQSRLAKTADKLLKYFPGATT